MTDNNVRIIFEDEDAYDSLIEETKRQAIADEHMRLAAMTVPQLVALLDAVINPPLVAKPALEGLRDDLGDGMLTDASQREQGRGWTGND